MPLEVGLKPAVSTYQDVDVQPRAHVHYDMAVQRPNPRVVDLPLQDEIGREVGRAG